MHLCLHTYMYVLLKVNKWARHPRIEEWVVHVCRKYVLTCRDSLISQGYVYTQQRIRQTAWQPESACMRKTPNTLFRAIWGGRQGRKSSQKGLRGNTVWRRYGIKVTSWGGRKKKDSERPEGWKETHVRNWQAAHGHKGALSCTCFVVWDLYTRWPQFEGVLCCTCFVVWDLYTRWPQFEAALCCACFVVWDLYTRWPQFEAALCCIYLAYTRSGHDLKVSWALRTHLCALSRRNPDRWTICMDA